MMDTAQIITDPEGIPIEYIGHDALVVEECRLYCALYDLWARAGRHPGLEMGNYTRIAQFSGMTMSQVLSRDNARKVSDAVWNFAANLALSIEHKVKP